MWPREHLRARLGPSTLMRVDRSSWARQLALNGRDLALGARPTRARLPRCVGFAGADAAALATVDTGPRLEVLQSETRLRGVSARPDALYGVECNRKSGDWRRARRSCGRTVPGESRVWPRRVA